MEKQNDNNKQIYMKFSERHCRIILYHDGYFDVDFIVHGIQYHSHSHVPFNFPKESWKFASGCMGNEFYYNKLNKVIRQGYNKN